MTLSTALIEQFQALHLAKYGEKIDAAAAELELQELADLVCVTAPKEANKNAEVTHD